MPSYKISQVEKIGECPQRWREERSSVVSVVVEYDEGGEMVDDDILVPNVALCASNRKGELVNMFG